MFVNSIDDIRIASPSRSDRNEMYGDDRHRFCGECKLNVYNLSGMTRDDAETVVMNAEGRLCVRFFRRSDGTVITKDCPVGWRAVKQRASRTAVALSSVVIGFLAGIFSLRATESLISILPIGDVPALELDEKRNSTDGPVVGEISEDELTAKGIRKASKGPAYLYNVGRIESMQR